MYLGHTCCLFWDHENGGLFYTGNDAETLVTRSNTHWPAPNLLQMAWRRWRLLDWMCCAHRSDLGGHADRILRSYQTLLSRKLRGRLDSRQWPPHGGQEDIGNSPSSESPTTPKPSIDRDFRSRHLPFCALAPIAPADLAEAVQQLPWLEGKQAMSGQPTAWLCEGFSCKLPTQSPDELAAQLDGLARSDAQEAGADRPTAPALPRDPANWLNTPDPISLDDLRGQVVVLDFWTYCCINCLHVLPRIGCYRRTF